MKCVGGNLIDTYPVEQSFVGEVDIRPCSPSAIAHALVHDDVERLVIRPSVGGGIGSVRYVALAVGPHILAIHIPVYLVLVPIDGHHVPVVIVDARQVAAVGTAGGTACP